MGAAAVPAVIALAGLQMYGSYESGKQQKSLLKMENEQLGIQSNAENLRSTQKQNAIQTQLNKDLASARAIFGARGISATSATATAIQNQSLTNASRDVQNIRLGNEINQSQIRSQQGINTQTGKNIMRRSFFEGAGAAGQTGASYYSTTQRSNTGGNLANTAQS